MGAPTGTTILPSGRLWSNWSGDWCPGSRRIRRCAARWRQAFRCARDAKRRRPPARRLAIELSRLATGRTKPEIIGLIAAFAPRTPQSSSFFPSSPLCRHGARAQSALVFATKTVRQQSLAPSIGASHFTALSCPAPGVRFTSTRRFFRRNGRWWCGCPGSRGGAGRPLPEVRGHQATALFAEGVDGLLRLDGLAPR